MPIRNEDGDIIYLLEKILMSDMPLSSPVKLLRLLETGIFRRVGSAETIEAASRTPATADSFLG